MNKEFMKEALRYARDSGKDVPVGAVIVRDGVIIAQAHNQKEQLNDATMHAEIVAIRLASKHLGTWRLAGCELYVTLEPCPMCASAIIQSRISNVYFGSYDSLYGAFGSKINMKDTLPSNLEIKGGILQEECDNIIRSYFEELR